MWHADSIPHLDPTHFQESIFTPINRLKIPGQCTRYYLFFSRHEMKKYLKLITSKTSNHIFVSGGSNYYTALRI
jgi:hypothetical protein